MNGSRLSDDAAFAEGSRMLRSVLSGAGDDDTAERALRMIGMRYPEEADSLRALLAAQSREQCVVSLAAVEERHREEESEA